MIQAHAQEIAKLAAKMRIPSAGNKGLADAAGLIGYGVNVFEIYRRAGTYVDKILKDAKPADLPVEQATKFELIINLKTAKALGMAIPQAVLLRAHEMLR